MKFILMIVLSIASMFTWASEEIISIEKFDHDPSVSTYMILAMNNKWGEGAGSGSTYKISREKSNNNLNSLEIFYDFPSEKRDVMMIMFKKNYIKEKNLEFFVYDANLEFWFYGDNSENILMVKYLNQDSNYERRISINWNGWKLISIPLKEGNFGVEGFCLQDKEESYKGSGTLYLNNIYCLERKPKEALELAKIKHLIKVNQVGYEPKSKKIAFLGIPGEANTNIATAIKTDTASVIDENGNIAFQGKIPDLKYDSLSGDWVGEIDFSSLQKTGTYRVIAGGAYCSYPFKIGSDVYRKLFRDSCRTLYLWRCGTAINDEDNHFNRRACHLNDKFNESGNTDLPQTIDAVGGWHDAADFHKNAIAHGLVNGELLQAYEIMPSKFQGDNWGIPESGNNTPDILDEVKWGMTWLLKIQLRDGSVPNSVEWINKSLSRAEDDKNLRYLDKAGLKSTEIFCAAAAKTAYVMKKIDPEFANRCELAAIKSWNFIEETRKKQLWFNSGRYESGNGGYKGAYFWAAGEMFRLTGQSKYSFIIKDLLNSNEIPLRSINLWSQQLLGVMAAYSASEVPAELKEQLRQFLLNNAEYLLKLQDDTAYPTIFRPTRHDTASIAGVLALLYVWENVDKQNKYIDAAQNEFDHLLGRNALNTSMVSGFGCKQAQIYYVPFLLQGYCPPGLVVAGPSKFVTSPVLKDLPESKRFENSPYSFMCCEPTIYCQTSLIILSAFFN